MRILYLGDIVGEKSIPAIKSAIDEIKKDYKINMVLANAENTSGGKGLTLKHYKELKNIGIVAMSMGNHTFSKSEIKDYIDEANIVRPANIPTSIGKGYMYINYNDKKIALVNLMGRTFMSTSLDCPFQTMDKLLNEIEADYIIVDFHGEATSEKKAFFYDFQGRVDAILGTHTHVQTADEEVLNNTCYITDMGMCGPHSSIIGDDKDQVISRFRTGMFEPLKVSTDKEIIINGVILDFGVKNSIIRINKKVSL